MAGFEQLIIKGDHAGFFKALDQLNSSSEMWNVLHLKSVELYIEQGLLTEALKKSLLLKNSLTDPAARKQAEIFHLYLNSLLNGRQEKQEVALLEMCEDILSQPKHSDLHLFTKNMCLRLSANKLMMGMVDANLKGEIVASYSHFIERCLQNGAEQEAFSAILEICHLLISKPLPMPEKSMTYLKLYEKQTFVEKMPHRKAAIALCMAELELERHLSGNENNEYLRYYKLALKVYEEIKHKFGRQIIDESYGKLLLSYGKSKGKRFLDRAIHGFEKKGAFRQSFEAYAVLLHWLGKKGNTAAINSYQIRINVIREETGNHFKPLKMVHQEEDDLLRLSVRLMCLANEMTFSGKRSDAIILTQKALPKFEQRGDTLHLANVLVYLSELTDSPAASLSKSTSQKAIRLYNRLGYTTEASEVLKSRLIRWSELAYITGLNSKEIKQAKEEIQLADLIPERKTNLESQEALISSHQAIAYLYTRLGSMETALSHLDKAEDCLKKYGLTPGLAFNTFYRGCILIEMGLLNKVEQMYIQAVECFHDAQQIFQLLNNREGVWRSQFGKALSTHQSLILNKRRPTILLQECIAGYNKALETVHRLTIYHVKTQPHFGNPFNFSLCLQEEAESLFTSAVDFFTHVAKDPDQVSKLMERKNTWVVLNKQRPELKLN